MSFSKTVSSVAALTTIFGASIAAWKVVQYNESKVEPQTKQLEQQILQLQKDLEKSRKKQDELLNLVLTPKSPESFPPPPELKTTE